MGERSGRNDPCPCRSGKKYKRCCLDSDKAAMSSAGARGRSTASPDPALTLLVETPRGPMVRTIPSASPLRTDVQQGYAAEEATHDAAAVWGLPDFVFKPQATRVGSGQRELGDGLIVVGDIAAVVQVKSREALSSDPQKERKWLEKKAAEGLRQANGTVRRLRLRPERLTNLRGTTLELDGNRHRWLSIVVLDHSDPPDEATPALEVAKHPAVVLLRRDWEFLFDQLKSTHAVLQHFARVAGEGLALGDEPARYYDLARSDAEASPSDFPERASRGGLALLRTPAPDGARRER